MYIRDVTTAMVIGHKPRNYLYIRVEMLASAILHLHSIFVYWNRRVFLDTGRSGT